MTEQPQNHEDPQQTDPVSAAANCGQGEADGHTPEASPSTPADSPADEVKETEADFPSVTVPDFVPDDFAEAGSNADQTDQQTGGEASETTGEGEGPTAEDVQAKLAALTDELARAQADLFNLNQEYAGYVRRSKAEAPSLREAGQAEVVTALISVLDDIYAARQHGALEEGSPFAAIADKLEQTLTNQFKVERFGEAGEEFDPNLHEALMAQENGEVEVPTIAQVLQPGYRMGERVLRATKVMVSNPA